MTVEYVGGAAGWSPSGRTMSGLIGSLLPPAIPTYLYGPHKQLRNTARWPELQQLVFNVQLPGLNQFQDALGTECADLFARELETSAKFVIRAEDRYGRLLSAARQALPTGVPMALDDIYDLMFWAEQVPTLAESFLDLLAKYLYVLLFDRCPEVDAGTGGRRRSYFREFMGIFVQKGPPWAPQTTNGTVRHQGLFDLLHGHQTWLGEVQHLRDMIQHSGRLSLMGWTPDGGAPDVGFAMGWIQPPLHPKSYVSGSAVTSLGHGFRLFLNDVVTTLTAIYAGF